MHLVLTEQYCFETIESANKASSYNSTRGEKNVVPIYKKNFHSVKAAVAAAARGSYTRESKHSPMGMEYLPEKREVEGPFPGKVWKIW